MSLSRALRTAVLLLLLVLEMNALPLCAAADPAPTNVPTTAGCANYWMFNGVWRVRITGYSPHLDEGSHNQIGWDVNEQWRNGTTQTITPGDSIQ